MGMVDERSQEKVVSIIPEMGIEAWLLKAFGDAEKTLSAQNPGKEFKVDQVLLVANCRAIDQNNEILSFQLETGVLKDPGTSSQKLLKIVTRK
jgi:hypothetical protein